MVESPFRIMGVDPGLNRTGYGIISIVSNTASVVDYGVISSTGKISLEKRLANIYNRVSDIISQHLPHVLAIEQVFFAKNVESALKLGHARAAAILAGVHKQLKIYEYSALEVKKSVTSYGRADKEQVQSMVKTLLGLNESFRHNDSSDALAVALCHFHSMKFHTLIEK